MLYLEEVELLASANASFRPDPYEVKELVSHHTDGFPDRTEKWHSFGLAGRRLVEWK